MASPRITKSYLNLYGLPWNLQPPDGLQSQYAGSALLGAKSCPEKSGYQPQKRGPKGRPTAGSTGFWPQSTISWLSHYRWVPLWPPQKK